jgi:hypothetical protein
MNKVYLPIPGVPVEVLLAYLHSKMALSGAFDLSIMPMLQAIDIAKEYHCIKIMGVMRTAYWIHAGYGFETVTLPDKDGIPVRHIVDVYGPGKIMLHADGFFNNEKTVREFWIAAGAIVVSFTQQNFVDLKLGAHEVDTLATCILAENSTLSLMKSCMLKMPGLKLLKEMNRIFGRQIWQHFSQAELSDYTGLTVSYLSRIKAKVYEW